MCTLFTLHLLPYAPIWCITWLMFLGQKWGTKTLVHLGVCVWVCVCVCVCFYVCLCPYQLRQASLGEDTARAGDVQVSGDPAPHVEPLHGALGWRPVLPVQQHQLLLGPHGTALQHPLQLKTRQRERGMDGAGEGWEKEEWERERDERKRKQNREGQEWAKDRDGQTEREGEPKAEATERGERSETEGQREGNGQKQRQREGNGQKQIDREREGTVRNRDRQTEGTKGERWRWAVWYADREPERQVNLFLLTAQMARADKTSDEQPKC